MSKPTNLTKKRLHEFMEQILAKDGMDEAFARMASGEIEAKSKELKEVSETETQAHENAEKYCKLAEFVYTEYVPKVTRLLRELKVEAALEQKRWDEVNEILRDSADLYRGTFGQKDK